MYYLDIFGIQFHTFGMTFQITPETSVAPSPDQGLRLAGQNVPAEDDRQVLLYLFQLPDGSEMEMVAVSTGDFVMGADDSNAKAARGSDGRKYPWGNVWDTTRANFLDASCPGDTIQLGDRTLDEHMAQFGGRDMVNSDGVPYPPVGSFPAGTSPYGALDMAGNVCNWCEDWWDAKNFPRSTQGDFFPPQGARGGSLAAAVGQSWPPRLSDFRAVRVRACGPQ
jgi:formylglycine-generating enzyme required for sulfatase activity